MLLSLDHRCGVFVLIIYILTLQMDLAFQEGAALAEEHLLPWYEHRQSHDSITKRPIIKGYDRPPGPGPHGYEIQFIGYTRYVKPDEESARNFCSSFFCTNDAFYIFTKSSQYLGLEACADFRNFSVDHVVQVDVPDDRDQYRGFQSIVARKYFERLRKVAATSKVIKFARNDTSRARRVVRNHFAQCLRSPLVLRHLQAHRDVVERLEALGGSPHLHKHRNFNKQLFNADPDEDFGRVAIQTRTLRLDFDAMDDEWRAKREFNVSRLFEADAWFAGRLFLGLEVKRCSDDVLCLTAPASGWDAGESGSEQEFEDFKQLLNDLEDFYLGLRPLQKVLDESYYKPGLDRRRDFLKRRNQLRKQHERDRPSRMRIGELQALMPADFEVSWLRVVNSELLEEARVTDDEEILIEGGVELLQALVRNLLDTDKRIIADTFVLTFLYEHRHQLILRFHNKQQLHQFGFKKGWQRWYTCLRQSSLRDFMYPALLVMYEEQRGIWDRTLGDFDRNLADERLDILGSGEKMAREAADEFRRRFIKEGAQELPLGVAFDVLTKLKQLKVVTSLKASVFPSELLEAFYKELPLNGDENFMKSTWEMAKHHRKIVNEPRQSWRRQVDRMVYAKGGEHVTYNIQDGNILYIPPSVLIYPWYHPLRPRFFNMATFYAEVIAELYFGVQTYVQDRYGKLFEPINVSSDQVAYEVYREWLTTNADLQIGANYLTNKQLFWMARAVSDFVKFHRTVPESREVANRLQHMYLHVLYKSFEGFQDAFNCSLTEAEKRDYEEFDRKWASIEA